MSAHAETLANALKHAHELLRHEPHLTKLQVAEKTAQQFNLGPLDEDWLLNHLTQAKPKE
jgi:hypothetical protein